MASNNVALKIDCLLICGKIGKNGLSAKTFKVLRNFYAYLTWLIVGDICTKMFTETP